jgi:hypothetical protein
MTAQSGHKATRARSWLISPYRLHLPGDVHARGHFAARYHSDKTGAAPYGLEFARSRSERRPPEQDTSAPLTRSRSPATGYYFDFPAP